MKISFAAIKSWVLSFLPRLAADRQKLALGILEVVFAQLPDALKVVEAIEVRLKPALNTSSERAVTTVENFLSDGLDGPELTAARKEAQRIAYYPKAELLTCVALFLLSRNSSISIPSRLLRLAVVYAYNEFIGAQSETKVPGSN